MSYDNFADNGGQDTDMLTDHELVERGYEPRFVPTTELSDPPRATYKGDPDERKCEFCNRKMKNPVSSFTKYGVEFIGEGKLAHAGCARRQFEIIADVLKKTEEMS